MEATAAHRRIQLATLLRPRVLLGGLTDLFITADHDLAVAAWRRGRVWEHQAIADLAPEKSGESGRLTRDALTRVGIRDGGPRVISVRRNGRS